MDRARKWRSVRNPLWTVAAIVVVIEGLEEQGEWLLPIVVAVFLAIILSPAVRWMERRRIPKVAAVLAVVTGLMLLLGAIGGVIGGSVASFTTKSDQYGQQVAEKVSHLQLWLEERGVELSIEKAQEMVHPGDAAKKAMQYVGSLWDAATTALSNTLLVMLTMVLILLEGDSVPARLRALSSHPEADISHFKQIATDVQRYLGIKTILSLGTGALVWLWCVILSVDFALLWGLLAFLLNYIPNIGSIISAIPAVLLALVQHGPGTALALAAGYVVVNMVVGNVVEPMWMGRKLGLSTVVVLLSLVVWYEIWGTLGALLSVPLTMVIKIMLESSTEWAFVGKLLGPGQEAIAEGPPCDAAVASTEAPPTVRARPSQAAPAPSDPRQSGDTEG